MVGGRCCSTVLDMDCCMQNPLSSLTPAPTDGYPRSHSAQSLNLIKCSSARFIISKKISTFWATHARLKRKSFLTVAIIWPRPCISLVLTGLSLSQDILSSTTPTSLSHNGSRGRYHRHDIALFPIHRLITSSLKNDPS
jgi:hypothetical protein